MKEVLAVIRMNRINQTKKALVEAGFSAFTGCKVMGRGSRAVDFELQKALLDESGPSPEALASFSRGPRLIAKRMLSMVVPDERVPSVVETLMQVNRTGSPGDGKIFVLPVVDAVRVRTGEAGSAAVDEMNAA